MRQTQRRSETGVPHRGRLHRRRSPLVAFIVAVLALTLLLGAFLYSGRGTSSGGTAIASSVSLGRLTTDRPAGLVGGYQYVSSPLLEAHKPLLLFIGAQYCPFCAAERWAIVKALSRFGTWSGLATGHSTSGEGGFGDIPTIELLHATYHSAYVGFTSKDVADARGNPLQHLTPAEQQLFNTYDTSGAIPMVYVDGYVLIGSDYSPSPLQGRLFDSVQAQLQQDQGTSSVRAINGEANLLTAFLCKADGNHPFASCGNVTVQTIERGVR